MLELCTKEMSNHLGTEAHFFRAVRCKGYMEIVGFDREGGTDHHVPTFPRLATRLFSRERDAYGIEVEMGG